MTLAWITASDVLPVGICWPLAFSPGWAAFQDLTTWLPHWTSCGLFEYQMAIGPRDARALVASTGLTMLHAVKADAASAVISRAVAGLIVWIPSSCAFGGQAGQRTARQRPVHVLGQLRAEAGADHGVPTTTRRQPRALERVSLCPNPVHEGQVAR